MIDRSADKAGAAPEADDAAHSGLLHQFGTMTRAILASPVSKAVTTLIIGLIIVIGFTAYGQIRLNSWNKPFYDAVSRRDLHDFLFQLGVFFIIAGSLLVLN